VKLTALVTLTVTAILTTAAAPTATAGWTTTYGSANPALRAHTVPYFADSFDFGGVTYPYKMIGTNPRASTATTTVPAVIVPLRFVFADGHVFDPGSIVAATIASPLFQRARASAAARRSTATR
jgi:hypothetical protein